MKKILTVSLMLALVFCFGTSAFATSVRVSMDVPKGATLVESLDVNAITLPQAQQLVGKNGTVYSILYQQHLNLKTDSTAEVYTPAALYFSFDPVVVNVHSVGVILNGKYVGTANYNPNSGVAIYTANLPADITLVLMDKTKTTTASNSSTTTTTANTAAATAQRSSPKTGDTNMDALASAMMAMTICAGVYGLTRKQEQ